MASSSAAIDFYANAKRFKADMNANTSSDDGSLDGYADRSSASSPSLQDNSSPNSFLQMPLNSITNKLNQATAKPSFDFATAYNGLSSAAQNYYSTPQSYDYANSFQSPHLNPYSNQYSMPNMYQTNQYSNYQNYQNRLVVNNNNNRSSLGASSSSADSSSISLNSPTQTSDENTSPVQHQIQRSNPYNNLGMKDVSNQLQQSKPASNILNESSGSMNFNLGADENKASVNTNNASKKRRPVPVDAKDMTYWEKRRKNNESAKRSRDMRRMKEEHISVRVIYLEQDNLQLRTENALLRSEVEKLRAMMYSTQN